MRPSMHEWHGFTKVWMGNIRQFGRDSNYCRLARVMADSDNQRRPLADYIEMAAKCRAHFDEMEDGRLQRRKVAMERQGWVFEFSGHGWLATHRGLEINEPTLSKALVGVEKWGQGMRAYWAEQDASSNAARQALSMAKAIRAELREIGGGA